MPGMDGATVALEIQKAFRAFNAQMPFLFCCTAFYTEEFAAEARMAGINAFLSKPLSKGGLNTIIKQLNS